MSWRERFDLFFGLFAAEVERYGFAVKSSARGKLIEKFTDGEAGIFVGHRVDGRADDLAIEIFAQARYYALDEMLAAVGFVDRKTDIWMLGGNIGHLAGRGWTTFTTTPTHYPGEIAKQVRQALDLYLAGGRRLHEKYRSLESIYPLTDEPKADKTLGFNSMVQRLLVRLYLTKMLNPPAFEEEARTAVERFKRRKAFEREQFGRCLGKLREHIAECGM